jgi:release factor glutamine methyltransferase
MNDGVEAVTAGLLVARAVRTLAACCPTPRLDAEVLLGFLLGQPRARLLARPDTPVDVATGRRYDALLARRAAGEPLAYLTGRRGFWTLELAVDGRVLVPRPETELLVELALARLPAAGAARVLDLGTGSGAIALALAAERPRLAVTAVDRSSAALAVARSNAAALGLGPIDWREGDWFGAVPGQRFELIVSNPPYLAADDAHLGDDGLRFEPRDALVAGPNGLECLAAIAAGAARHLQPGGWLLVEHGATQGAAVRELLAGAGLVEIATTADLAGLPRVGQGRRPGG